MRDLFDEFRDLAHENRMHQTKMLRASVRMMVEDDQVADRGLELARETWLPSVRHLETVTDDEWGQANTVTPRWYNG